MGTATARLLYPADEAAYQLGIGLTTVKALIRTGELRSVKIGNARRVPADALREYAQRLDTEQNGDGARVLALAPPTEVPSTVHS